MKLRNKVFIIFTILAFVPLSIITLLAYQRYRVTTYEQMDTVSSNIYVNATEELESTIDDVKRSAAMFTFYSDSSYSIVENLKQFSDPHVTPDNYSILQANQYIKFVCQNILYSYDYINGLYVITPSGAVLRHFSVPNHDLKPDYDFEAAQWYQDTIDLDGSLYISSVGCHDMFLDKPKSVFFSESLHDVFTHENLGVLVIDCNPELFDLSTANTLPDITLFTLTNTDNDSILYTNATTVTSHFPSTNENVFEDTLSLDNLKLKAEFDNNALVKQYNMTGVLLLTMFAICSLAIVLLSYVLSKNLVYPIEHLSKKMASQSAVKLSLSGRYLNRSDEIGTLYNEYNSMIDELNSSIKRNYEDKLITLDAQMKSLEARINSHFLFNTLESINSIAEIEDNDRIATMALALGSMFRYSIKTESELVYVSDELQHVQDYVSIQSIRFDHRFQLITDISDDIRKKRVLKLILQPLVENALYHGLQYCASGDTITISGHIVDSYLYLSVSDNGIGVEPEQLQELKSRLFQESSFTELGHCTKESIGLKNIHTRIELYYGKGYGLTIQSLPDEGTTIQIKLPIMNS